MGGFSNFRSFFSNHLLSNSQSQSQSPSQQKQQKASLDDRSLHSFNPHYQHNLHSTTYSTPPSLASSPTNSSPTSTASSNSTSSYNKSRYSYSAVNGKGIKSPPQHLQHFPRRSYYHQQQIQQQIQQQQQQLLQQQQNSRQHHQHRSANGHQYQHTRRSYRNHHNQAYLYEEDELSLGSSSTATAMDLASPIDPSPLSVSMWQGRRRLTQQQQQQQQQQQHGRTSHILASRASETEKHASRASSKRSPSASRPQWPTPQSTKRHSSALDQYQYLSSSPFTISESRASTAVSYMQDVDVAEGVEMPSSTASSSSASSSSLSCDKMDAKTSLMRIAQCGRREAWCALQSGQYTRHYAGSRSGVSVDGRRARRM